MGIAFTKVFSRLFTKREMRILMVREKMLSFVRFCAGSLPLFLAL